MIIIIIFKNRIGSNIEIMNLEIIRSIIFFPLLFSKKTLFKTLYK